MGGYFNILVCEIVKSFLNYDIKKNKRKLIICSKLGRSILLFNNLKSNKTPRMSLRFFDELRLLKAVKQLITIYSKWWTDFIRFIA